MTRSILLIALLAFASAAGAQGFDYNYVTLGYSQVDFDDVNIDGDGIELAGSFAINEDFHAFGSYGQADLDGGIDASELSIGLGYNHSLSPAVDFVGSVSYEYVEIDVAGLGSVDDNGFGLGIGLRFHPADKIEVDAGIQYVDLSDSGSDTGFGAGFQYYITDAITIGVSAEWADDVSRYGLGGRFYFGN